MGLTHRSALIREVDVNIAKKDHKLTSSGVRYCRTCECGHMGRVFVVNTSRSILNRLAKLQD